LLLNAYRVLEGFIYIYIYILWPQPSPTHPISLIECTILISKIKNIHPSTNGYITYITLLFWMNSSITRYLIKKFVYQWLYNLYNSPFLDEFIHNTVPNQKFVHQWLYNL
jgi:hypothetical protein